MEIFRGMQGTKHSGRYCNTIINLVFYSLRFVKHVIYHANYTINTSSTKDIIIVGCSTYELRCAYYSIHLFNDSLLGLKKYSPVTPKKGPQLSYLNLRIIPSPFGISIDQKSHIQNTILAENKYFHTPFKAYRTFELTL